ncbi:MAG: CshA/CshB family fibrillar adhesin-related protein, partial [Gemella sp.]|nr:CshA/CshB family fibrillar adhesin-related protein [Gemella sp.]
MYNKEKSRFSLRKNKVYGTCSVLLGITIFSLVNSSEVKAGNLENNESILVDNNNNDKTIVEPIINNQKEEIVRKNTTIDNTNQSTITTREIAVEEIKNNENSKLNISESNSVSPVNRIETASQKEKEIKDTLQNQNINKEAEDFRYNVVYRDIKTTNIVKEENFTSKEANVSYTAKPVITSKENKPYILTKTENPIKNILLNKNEVGFIEYSVESMSSAAVRPRREEKIEPQGTGFRSVDNSTLPRGAAILNASGMVLPIQQLASKTYWINFGDPNAKITNLGTGPTGAKVLQVGTKYEKELIPDYYITAEITELRPWAGSDTNIGRPGGNRSNRPTNIAVKGPDTRWSHIYRAGMIQNIEAFFTAEYNNSNVGFAMNIKATYKGEPVVATVIAADGEEAASNTELIILQTSGTPWEIYANSKRDTRAGDPTPEHMLNEPANYKRGNYRPVPGQDIYNNNLRGSYNALPDSSPYKKDYSLEAANTIWQNPNQADGGLGSQIFGPVNTSLNNSVPIVMTTSKDAERGVDIGVYINSPGNQAAVVGFIVGDKGDAPLTYGTGMHLLNYELDPTPPYLGKVPAVIDIAPGDNPWKSDDIKGDEGNVQLTDAEIIPVIKAEGPDYSMEIIANPNGSTAAYVKGFVDFNNNGVFDDTEGSDTLRVTNAGKHTLTFSSRPQVTDAALEKLGVRVRIARNAIEIQGADGVASSGEVEDFETQLVHPPRGEKKVTNGGQGQTQTAKINFTAYGEIVDSDERNSIDENIAVKIVAPDGSLVSEWTEIGQGRYSVDELGNVKFIPEANFTGQAKGIVLRATDKNGVSTGWTSQTGSSRTNNDGTISTNNLENINDGSHTISKKTMDAVYVPIVEEVIIRTSDIVSAGVSNVSQNEQIPLENVAENVKTNYSFEDGTTSLTVANQGTYIIDTKTGIITFTPQETFVGTATPVKFVVAANIESEDGSNLSIKSNVANYTPTVYKIEGLDVETSDFQGTTQVGQPTFTSLNTEENTSLGDKIVDISKASYSFENGQTETIIAGEGKYTLDSSTGQVTFTPEASFVGKGQGVDVIASVNVTDSEGQILRVSDKAKYIPTTKPLEVNTIDIKSKGFVGEEQTGKPEFEETTGNPNILSKSYSFEDGSVRKEVIGQGLYIIDSTTGQVRFIPEKTFTGQATPIVIKQTLVISSEHTELTVKEYRREDTATYTPEVINLVPTVDNTTSTGSQGDAQVKTKDEIAALFTPGKEDTNDPTKTDEDGTPDEVEPIEADTIRLQDLSGKPVEPGTKVLAMKDGVEVGTYVQNEDGSITFQPKPDFIGTPEPAKIEAKDVSEDKVVANYTPTVTPITTTSMNVETKGMVGETQTGRPTFTNSGQTGFDEKDIQGNTYAFEDGQTTKTVDGQGTYTIDLATGTVTFKPEPQFTGVANPVTVVETLTVVADDNKTSEIKTPAIYTPEVVNLVPTVETATSKASQGDAQATDAKVLFKPGKETDVLNDGDTTPEETEAIDLKSIKLVGPNGPVEAGTPVEVTKDGKVVGTYTMDENGEITFQPKPDFVGEAPAVTVRANDISGDEVTTTYTPTITPIIISSTTVETKGMVGETQKGTPTFEIKGEDGSTYDEEDIKSKTYAFEGGQTTMTVDGVGTYMIDTTTGQVTFVPVPTFIGKAAPLPVFQIATVVGDDGKAAPILTESSYTPEVINLKPKAGATDSKASQGDAQVKTKDEIAVLFTPGKEDATKTDEDGTPDEVEAINPDTIRLQDASGNPVEPGTKVPAMKDGVEVGTYVQNEDGSITFQPKPDFIGTPEPAKIEAKDVSGDKVVANYTPTVTPITTSSTPKETKGMVGETQKGTPTFEIKGEDGSTYDEEDIKSKTYAFEGGETTKKVDGEGTYTIDPATGTVTFKPEPNFTGVTKGITVKETLTLVGDNGETAPIETTAKYTPEVVNLEPTAEDTTSTGSQGDAQVKTKDEVAALFTPGKEDATKTDEDGTPDEVEAINPDTIRLQDEAGNPVEPGTPVPAKDATGKEVGTYVQNPDGSITFQPKPDFVGTPVPAKIEAKDVSGDKVVANYTPTVTPIETKGEDKTSKGFAGETQTGTPTFTNSGAEGFDPEDIKEKTYAFDDNSTERVVPGEGTYTIDPATGTVTFVPEKGFTGVATGVTVKETLTVVGDNGETTPIETTAKYTPEVVNLTPTAEPATTSGSQGDKQTQDAKSLFTPGKEDANDPSKTDEDGTPDETEAIDPATIKLVGPNGPVEAGTPVPATKDGKEIGTYTMDENGVITFQPNPDFVGTPDPVTIEAKDLSGDRVETTYTPTVTPVETTSEDKESIDIQGATQTGQPTFDSKGAEGYDPTDVKGKTYSFEDDSTEKVVPGEGTYTIDPATGVVTFKPEPQFTGKTQGVTVKEKLTLVGDDGKEATIETTAKYTPEVTPVTPTATDVTSIDGQGVTQEGTPTFEGGHPNVPIDETVPATFEDGSTTKVVPGEGTYTVSPDGKVTFVPEKTFTGKGTGVSVVRVDKNRTKATGNYTPTVTPITPTAQPRTTEGPQGLPQTTDARTMFKEGDSVAPIDNTTITLLDENGNSVKELAARDENGNEIGIYSVDENVTVTFTPNKDYTGDVVVKPVRVQAKDTNGTPVETTYTPRVEAVYPQGEEIITWGARGKTQVATPSFTAGNILVPIDETVAATFEDGTTEKVIQGQGTYTVSPEGTITFIPEEDFVGAGSTLKIVKVDKNGTKAYSLYTAHVTSVPKDYPTYDLPEIVIDSRVPADYPTYDLPEIVIDSKIPEDYPTYDLPEIVIETKIPEDYPTVEKPEGQIGIVPKDYPTYDLPEIVIETKIPEDYPTVEKPEGQIGIVPKDYPTYDLPEIVIETKIPEDYPTIEKPEGQIG